MRKINILVLASFLMASMATTVAHADWHHGGGDHDHGGYHHGPSGGYDDGFLAGMLASTALLFASELSNEHNDYKELVYIGAADDAAQFLANGAEPSAMLRQAMDTERSFLDRNGIAEVKSLSDEDLAYLVIGRANSLNK